MLAQISDGKLSLGGFFNGFMVNVKEYESIINKFSSLDLSLPEFKIDDNEYNWKAISKSIGEVNYLTEAYFKSLADGNGVIDNTLASLDGMKAYLKQTGQAFDFAKLKAMALNSVLNIGVNAAISLGIMALFKLGDAVITTKKEIQEATEKASDNIKSTRDNFNKLESTINDIKERYAELAQGVKRTGTTLSNIDLSQSEYEEFLSLSNQLAELSPSLVAGYDNQGNAILSLGGSYDSIIDKLDTFIEKQREAANLEIKNNLPDLWKGAVSEAEDVDNAIEKANLDISNASDTKANLEKVINPYEQLQEFVKSSDDTIELIGHSEDEIRRKIADVYSILEEAGVQFSEDKNAIWSEDGETVKFSYYLEGEAQDIEKAKESINDVVNNVISEYTSELDNATKEINSSNTQLISLQEERKQVFNNLKDEIMAAISTEGSYKVLSDEMKNSVQSIVNNIDWGSLNFAEWEQAEDFINDNIISLFHGDNADEIQSAVQDMFDFQDAFESGKKTIQDYENYLNNFIDGLGDISDEVKNALKESFKMTASDGADIETMVNHIASKVTNEMDGAIKGLSWDDLQFAYEIVDNGELTWEELQHKIDVARKAGEVGIDIHARTNLEEYNKATETKNPRDDYDAYTEMLTKAKELYKKGEIGSDDFKAAAKAFSMNGMDDPVNFAENISYLGQYFTEGSTGLEKFVKKMQSLNYAEWSDEQQAYTLKLKDMKQVATDMGMPFEMLTVLLQGLQQYGFTNDYFGTIEEGTEHLTSLYKELNTEQAKLDKMEKDGTTGTALEQQEEKVKSLQERIESTKGSLEDLFNLDIDTENLDEQYSEGKKLAQNLVDEYKNIDWSSDSADYQAKAIKEAAKQLEQEFGVKIVFENDTASIDDSIEKAKEKISECQKRIDELRNSNGKLNLDDSEVQDAVRELRNAYQEKLKLEHPGIMSMDTSGLRSDVAHVIEQYQLMLRLSAQIEADKKLGLDTTNAEQRLQGILDDLNTVDNKEVSAELGLEVEGKTVDEFVSDLKEIDTIEIPTTLQQPKDLAGFIEKTFGDNGITITATVNGVDDIEKLKDTIEKLPKDNQPVNITCTVAGSELVTPLSLALDSIASNANVTITVSGSEESTTQANNVATSLDNIEDAEPVITIHDTNSYIINNIRTSLEKLNGTTATSYIKVVKTETTAGGTSPVNGTAHSDGTVNSSNPLSHAWSYYMGTNYGIYNGAYVGGNWGLPYDQTALVGELEPELLVRDGHWKLIGVNGAEFLGLKKGDIIFNGKQTREIFANGYVTGRGKPIGFNSHVMGTVSDNAFSGGGTGTSTGSFGGAQTMAQSKWKIPSTKSQSSTSNSSSLNQANDSAEEFEETLDEIQIAIDRIERMIDSLDKKASSTFKSWSERNQNLVTEISKVREEIEMQQLGYERYMQQAESVGLSEDWKQKIQDGRIDIETITDETLNDQIQEYQQWYELALDCRDAIDDITESVSELYQTAFDNISTQYDAILSKLEHQSNLINTYIDKAEEQGYLANDAYYKALSKIETQKLEQLKKEQRDLIASLNDAVDNGDITVNSEAWNEMQSSINDVTEAIAESEKALVEFNNEIRQISWDVFDFIQDRVSKITSEAEFLINLMDNKELYDDKGMLTEQGLATMAMHGANYNTYMEQSLAYAKELEKLNKEIANNPYDTKLIERREELLELQQENILAAEDEKDAIRDMVEEGINKELESLQDLIDKYNESLDAQKDLYDYQKKVAEQTKNIAELQKQLSVYEQDLSEETKAKVQQIKVSLEEAQDNLKETQYDQYITDQKKLLDDLYTEYEDTLNSHLDNLDALIIDMVEKINMNADGIKQTLISESKNVGYVLTDAMTSIWNTESADGKVLTTYMGNFDALSGNFSTYVNTQSTRWTSLQTTLGTINANIGKLVTASGQQAESDVKQTINPITEATGTPVIETPAAPTPTPTPEPVQEEKVITVGGMINAGSAPIYSYAGSNKAYKQYFSDDPVYTVVKEQDGYLLVRHHKATSGLTGWFKKSDVKAYKKGGLVDYTGLAQLDGTPSEPEMVLNSEDTKNLIELKDNLKEIRKGNIIYRPVDLNKKFGEISTLPEHLKVNIADDMVRILSNSMKEFHVPEVQRQSLSFGDINYEFNIAIDHVENYDDFVNKMRKDPKVEKMVQAMTVDQMMGRSKLGKYYV